MYRVQKTADIRYINDETTEEFLKKYVHLIVPRKNPIELSPVHGGVKIGDKLFWKNSKFYIIGNIFGEEYAKEISEEQAKTLLPDLGDAEELAFAVTLAGGKVLMTSRTKLYAEFGRIVLLFTIMSNTYYFLQEDGIMEIKHVKDIEEVLHKAKELDHPLYNYIIYGQSSIVYVKEYGEFRLALKHSNSECTVELLRDDTYPTYLSGTIIYILNFSCEYFSVALDALAAEDNPLSIIKIASTLIL